MFLNVRTAVGGVPPATTDNGGAAVFSTNAAGAGARRTFTTFEGSLESHASTARTRAEKTTSTLDALVETTSDGGTPATAWIRLKPAIVLKPSVETSST